MIKLDIDVFNNELEKTNNLKSCIPKLKESILYIVNDYITVFPKEKDKLKPLVDYVNEHTYDELTDWNNFNGHIVASGFVYDKSQNKFLLLYHNDMKKYLYPGGHVDDTDEDILSASKREVKEETGVNVNNPLQICPNKEVPFDIDIHKIPFNERLNLPEHYHYDFRYIYVVDKTSDIKLDESESSEYKFVSIDELRDNKDFGNIVNKIEEFYNVKL